MFHGFLFLFFLVSRAQNIVTGQYGSMRKTYPEKKREEEEKDFLKACKYNTFLSLFITLYNPPCYIIQARGLYALLRLRRSCIVL